MYILTWNFFSIKFVLPARRQGYKFSLFLRRGANTNNLALGQHESKGAGKGKKNAMVFPMLQVGQDPYGHKLRKNKCNIVKGCDFSIWNSPSKFTAQRFKILIPLTSRPSPNTIRSDG